MGPKKILSVSMGKSLDLDVSGQDVEELVECYREELSTKELKDLQLVQQQTAAEEMASGDEKRIEYAFFSD